MDIITLDMIIATLGVIILIIIMTYTSKPIVKALNKNSYKPRLRKAKNDGTYIMMNGKKIYIKEMYEAEGYINIETEDK